VVINTPGGSLLGVDTLTGKSEVLMDQSSPIEDLCVHQQKRMLLVGSKGNTEVRSTLKLLGFA